MPPLIFGCRVFYAQAECKAQDLLVVGRVPDVLHALRDAVRSGAAFVAGEQPYRDDIRMGNTRCS